MSVASKQDPVSRKRFSGWRILISFALPIVWILF